MRISLVFIISISLVLPFQSQVSTEKTDSVSEKELTEFYLELAEKLKVEDVYVNKKDSIELTKNEGERKSANKKVLQNNKSANKTDWENHADIAIATAEEYLGTKHKMGGSDKSGIDCSGLVKTAYSSLEIDLPRTSMEQSDVGIEIARSDIRKGDLLFFKISRNSISHVGIVTQNIEDEIKFIHTSSSSGVIVSNLSESYWEKSFAKAMRIIN